MEPQLPHIDKLPNAPLQEVIFEVLWEMEYDSAGNPIDRGFELAQGVFASKIKEQFSVRKRTIPEEIPLRLIYPKPIHQFWRAENEFPLIQLGPGILALNDIEKNYEWKNSFSKEINYSLKILEESYEYPLSFFQVSLRYIDAVEIPDTYNNEDIGHFVNDHFKIKIENQFEQLGKQTGININQVFTLSDDSKLNLIISNGLSQNNETSIIWQTHIFKKEKFDVSDVLNWVQEAHNITSKMFKETLKQQFYDSFK